MTAKGTQDLGPFAPERGARSPAALAGAVVGGAAVALAGLRIALDEVRPGGDHSAFRTWATWAAALAAAIALAGAYQIATRGMRGRTSVVVALMLATTGGITAYLYGAIHDGTLRLDRFADRFLDLELMRLAGPDLARGAVNTLELAAAGEVLAILLGLVLATFHLSRRRWLHLPAVAYVDLVRGLPLLVLTALIYGGLPSLGITLDPFPAAVAVLTINASAYVAEIFRAGIQSITRGQMDAARSLGMPRGTAMLFVVIPQAVRSVIPPLMSEFIALVKDTAIVISFIGFTVASADLFGAARTIQASTFSPTPYVAASIGYLIITVPLTRLVGRLERRLRVGLA